jgi:RNA polymerase sigma factor (sigma-70 family)
MDETEKIQCEAKLWDDFISGNVNAFRIIYDRYVQELFRFGLHFSKSEDLVLDAIHDLFIDLYNYRPQLKSGNNIKRYLFLSLKRKIFRLQGEESRYLSFDSEKISFSYFLTSSDEESNGNNKLKLLEKAMAELSDRQREAIYLRYVSGLSYEELSEVLQLNYQSARNLIHRGMEKLRKCYQKKLVSLLYLLFSS